MNDFFIDSFSNKKVPLSNILNSVIDGDNLSVLEKLKKYYVNKVKLIYIDPPYNTKRKFTYNDNFGSHLQWSEMMRPRLEVAYDLLKNDGFIFISIDDNEIHYLRILMDKIFGEDNFRNCIIIPRGVKNVQSQFVNSHRITVGHEYLLFYSKNKNSKIKKFEFNRIDLRKGNWNNHWRGTDRPNLRYEIFGITPKMGQWRWSKERSEAAILNYLKMFNELKKTSAIFQFEDLLQRSDLIDKWYLENYTENRKIDLLRLNKKNKPEHYVSPTLKRTGSDIWTDLKNTGTHDLKRIIPEAAFDMPKSLALIKRIIHLITEANNEDIIIDFFAGSGTTGQAVFEQNLLDNGNRKVILIQISEKILGLSQYEIYTLPQLAYKRIEIFLKQQNIDYKFNFLKDSL
ncbi:site-specific DNA-methyltransferase [Fluviispira multicolorata]|uniref:site-specific DNA-methyltransferase (adenine-specific) n=1 Tax=Fluviispira multicolorata TaxID=2654512 RepID=A0A833JB83_9BACT|nr:site-specific DNA-methyltransferase [Fluviispira multicolorata]KAB8029059.1 hypothetical protein GCL57_10995 [Fluviispira multicolorata]